MKIIQFEQIQIHLHLIKLTAKEEESRYEGSWSRNVKCILCLQTSIVRRQYLDAKENNQTKAAEHVHNSLQKKTNLKPMFQINVRCQFEPTLKLHMK